MQIMIQHSQIGKGNLYAFLLYVCLGRSVWTNGMMPVPSEVFVCIVFVAGRGRVDTREKNVDKRRIALRARHAQCQ